MSGDARRCGNCEWWDIQVPPLATGFRRPAGSDPDIGTCHRFAPSVLRSAGFQMPMFPETHRDRFCGDWMVAFDPDDGGGGEEADAGLSVNNKIVPIGRAAA